jgi:hypothetical protein
MMPWVVVGAVLMFSMSKQLNLRKVAKVRVAH